MKYLASFSSANSSPILGRGISVKGPFFVPAAGVNAGS